LIDRPHLHLNLRAFGAVADGVVHQVAHQHRQQHRVSGHRAQLFSVE
jgi:hypothetical protein